MSILNPSPIPALRDSYGTPQILADGEAVGATSTFTSDPLDAPLATRIAEIRCEWNATTTAGTTVQVEYLTPEGSAIGSPETVASGGQANLFSGRVQLRHPRFRLVVNNAHTSGRTIQKLAVTFRGDPSTYSWVDEDVDSTGNISDHDLPGPLNTLTFHVGGSFEGAVLRLRGRVPQDGPFINMPVRGPGSSRDAVIDISEEGIYRADITGLASLRFRLNSLDSGSMTITAVASDSQPPEIGTPRARNALLQRNLNVAVGGEAFLNLPNLSASDTPIIYCSVRSDEVHDFEVEAVWSEKEGTGQTTFGGHGPAETAVVVENGDRGTSEWLEVRGNQVQFRIRNESTSQRNYDLFVFGIR